MKRHLLTMLIFASFIGCCLWADVHLVGPQKRMAAITHGQIREVNRDVNTPAFSFFRPPTQVISSFYDYMIGGYSNPPLRVVPDAHYGGLFATYQGKRTVTGQRRVFYLYITEAGVIGATNEITGVQNWEGFPSLDVDPLSGIPLYAWHVNADTDDPFEVQFTYDAFLDGIPGLFETPIILVDNPYTIPYPLTTDNEFIWPNVTIGPSPIPDRRRVYVVTSNRTTHAGTRPSENILIFYADFNAQMLQDAVPLTWATNTIPELDVWNSTADPFRRPYCTFTSGPDGRVYYIGHHIAFDSDNNPIDEPAMDVFINDNYAMGTWRRVSQSALLPSWNPRDEFGQGEGVFKDDDGIPYPDSALTWDFANCGHFNAVVDNHGRIHFPALFALQTNEGTYYPSLHTVKNVTFNTNTETFIIRDVYPQDINPYNDIPFTPWDVNEDNDVDEYSDEGDPLMEVIWPFFYWDSSVHENAMFFHYNLQKITQPNPQGMMAMVWQDSYRARRYNQFQDTDYQAYANAPEIYISIGMNQGGNIIWYDPIVINPVDTPQFAGLTPEYVYPADKIEYLGTTPTGEIQGRLYLMFYHDNSWGSYQQSPPVGQNSGGDIKYMALDFTVTADDDQVIVSPPAALSQNYPNPFNPETTISYHLYKTSKVNLSVYNLKGQRVKTLVNSQQANGKHSIVWNGTDDRGEKVSSGIYLYQLTADGKTVTRKMMLMK